MSRPRRLRVSIRQPVRAEPEGQTLKDMVRHLGSVRSPRGVQTWRGRGDGVREVSQDSLEWMGKSSSSPQAGACPAIPKVLFLISHEKSVNCLSLV